MADRAYAGTAEPPKCARWLARGLLALGAPLVLLLGTEGALRIAGYGVSADLFIRDAKPGYYRTNPNFTSPYFPPQFDITPLNFRIARTKEAGHVRIFVLGESAVRGTPEPGFGFASLLGPQLRAAYPGKAIEVYNLGIVAINSHVIQQVARQVPPFQPDLLIVYMGNNEVVGPYGPGSATFSGMPPLPLIRASIWVACTRTGQLIRQFVNRFSATAIPALEWKGMSTFEGKTVRGDDPRLDAVYRNFEANLRDIISMAKRSGVRIVLSTVVANLKDSPPFASVHKKGLTETELKKWATHYGAGLRSWELDQTDDARRELGAALKIDTQFAEAHFVMGRVLGDAGASRAEYLEALHWDALRFRPDPRINDIVRTVASDSKAGVILVDAARELGSDSASTAPSTGRELLLEHVHFNWDGNRRMSRMLGEASGLALFGPPAPTAAWLDEHGCADAVGFTSVGRLRMLTEMQAIRGKPPFTSQLTFGEDQFRYQRELNLASQAASSRPTLEAAQEQLEAATKLFPEDSNLELQLSEIEAQSGQPEKELHAIDRLLELEPRTADLLVRRARALDPLQRGAEAEAGVLESLRLDPYNLPSYTALVETLRLTGNVDLGREVFKAALARSPSSDFIRLSYADLLFFHGYRDQAVKECLSVLKREPGDADALRRLVSLDDAAGLKAEAFELMAAARATQPLNFENDLALARIYDERGDEDKAAACLADAARGGPATAQLHLYLARHFRKEGQKDDALVELARARRVSVLADDPEMARQITATIAAVSRD
jgi:tetratricopeptide (TPR) repeat protein/lysophospholipase L1-like esterase